MFQQTLPIELLELLLYHVSEDLATLKSCTLVCRTWLPDARRFLFHTVKLDDHTDYKQLLTTLKGSPVIRSYVRNLNLKILNDYRRAPETDREDVCKFLSENAPHMLETLEVEIEEDHYESDDVLLQNLCAYPIRLPTLRTFIAHVSLLANTPTYKVDWLGKTLFNINSSIEEIRLEIAAEGVDITPEPQLIWQWDRINWADIDRIIDPSRLIHLKLVTVTFEIHINVFQETEDWGREQLAELNLFKCGLLNVVFREPPREPSPWPSSISAVDTMGSERIQCPRCIAQ